MFLHVAYFRLLENNYYYTILIYSPIELLSGIQPFKKIWPNFVSYTFLGFRICFYFIVLIDTLRTVCNIQIMQMRLL